MTLRKNLWVLGGIIIGLPLLLEAAAPDPALYPYQRNISYREANIGKINKVIFDPEFVQQVKPDASNIQLVDKTNSPVPFAIFTGRSGKYLSKKIKPIMVSSKKEDNPGALIDNDPLTSYSFNEKKDGKDGSWILMDFSKPVPINRITTYFDTSPQLVRTMMVEGGDDPENLKIIKKRSEAKLNNDFSTPRVLRYLKITYWGPQVKIWDINFFISPEIELYFTPENNNQYRILYGDPSMKSIRYIERISIPKNIELEAMAGGKKINKLLKEDVDNDGIKNNKDNCLLVSNQDQNDQDGDRVGDLCDNAPKNKNFSQIDTDQDGVSDIIDNCKLVHNPYQEDMDSDQIGDGCDAGENQKVLNKNSYNYFLYGLLLILAIGLLAFFLSVQKQGSEKEQ